MTERILIRRDSQAAVLPDTGAIVIVTDDGPDWIIEFATADCAREFASNAIDALSCVHDREHRA